MNEDLTTALMRWTDTITRFHKKSCGLVVVATGGGSSAIAMLQMVPGASQTLLEAQIPYCPQALNEFLGTTPSQYCAPATALEMALAAYQRAEHLKQEPELPAIGLSCTASLVSQRPKRGEHRAAIAVQTPTQTRLQTLILQRNLRDRQAEEFLVSEHVLQCLSQAVGLSDVPQFKLQPGDQSQLSQHTAEPLLSRLWQKQINHAWAWADGRLQTDLPEPVSALLCGSFNPLHDGHTQLRNVSQRILGRKVGFELTITNADKAPLDYISIQERVAQFPDDPVLLTHAATFAEKSNAHPDTVFVVGIDTVARIVQAKYYGDTPRDLRLSMEQLRSNRCRFLVAGRVTAGRFQTLADIEIPSGMEDLFQQIPATEFRMDLSSTALREQQ